MRIKFIQKLLDKIRRKNSINNFDIQKSLLNLNKKLQDINYKQNLIMDYFLCASDAKSAKGALLVMQKNCIPLLKIFDEICKEQGIEYWLDFGSLLGAVRHNGFIPWDNDIDTAMLNKDFRKIINIIKEGVYPNIEIIEHIKDGVAYLKYKGEPYFYKHIDIFSYDNENDRIRKSFKTPIFPRYSLAIPKEIVFPIKRIKFENIELNCPNNYDLYLRFEYGNYTKLPHSTPIWEHKITQNEMQSIEYCKEMQKLKTRTVVRERERESNTSI